MEGQYIFYSSDDDAKIFSFTDLVVFFLLQSLLTHAIMNNEVNLHILLLHCSTISSNTFCNISDVSDCTSSLYALSLIALKHTIIRNITIATF